MIVYHGTTLVLKKPDVAFSKDYLDKVLSFEKENEKQLDFVCACRRGDKQYQNYDVIIGGVADDDVFKTVDMYFRGLC